MSLAQAHIPTKDESQQALEALQILREVPLNQALGGPGGRHFEVTLPVQALELLQVILSYLAKGNAVRLVPIHAELTTQQAADLLKVSRPYFVGLLDQGVLPYRRVGAHRRVLAQDLFAYQSCEEVARRQAARELTEEAQELEIEY